jgi:hypothetical protein
VTARLAALLACAALLLAAGCGDDSNGSPTTGTEPAGTEPAATDPTTTVAEPETAAIWLADRDFLRLGWRPAGAGQEGVEGALSILFLETSLTAIPTGTELLGIEDRGGTTVVDVSSAFGRSGDPLRVAQVVYTATPDDEAAAVEILVEGEPLTDLPGEHTRAEFEDRLAPVVVESPTGLVPVTSPIVVTGTANTFEANVVIRVVGDLGQELASTFATATCGSGCRGDFEASVEVSVPAEQSVMLIVGEEDASGGTEGRPPYTVEIPLLVRP